MKTPDRELYLAKKLVKEWHAKANKAISTFNIVEKEFTKIRDQMEGIEKKECMASRSAFAQNTLCLESFDGDQYIYVIAINDMFVAIVLGCLLHLVRYWTEA